MVKHPRPNKVARARSQVARVLGGRGRRHKGLTFEEEKHNGGQGRRKGQSNSRKKSKVGEIQSVRGRLQIDSPKEPADSLMRDEKPGKKPARRSRRKTSITLFGEGPPKVAGAGPKGAWGKSEVTTTRGTEPVGPFQRGKKKKR